MSDKLKGFLSKPIGRIAAVSVIAALLIVVAIVPGMLPKSASESDRKLARSIVNFTKADSATVTGSATVVSSSMNAKFDINVGLKQASKATGHINADIKFPGSTVKIPLDFVADSTKGEMYFKVSNTDELIASMKEGLEPFRFALSPIAVKVDNKWVLVKDDKKKVIDPCTTQIIDSFKSSKDMPSDLATFIANNKALQVKSIKTVGNANVYEMTFDANKLDDTFKDFKSSEMFKGLDKCNESYGEPDPNVPKGETSTSQQQTKTESTITITVDSSDRITKVDYKTNSNGSVGTVNLNVEYDKKVAVTVPTKDIVKMEDIQGDLTRAIGILMAPQLQGNNNMLAPQTQAPSPSGY